MVQVYVSETESEKHEVPLQPTNPGNVLLRSLWKLETWATEINGYHVAFKTIAFTMVAVYLYIGWKVLPVLFYWTTNGQHDKLPPPKQDLSHYFNNFKGFTECAISSADLYISPPKDQEGYYLQASFCRNRKSLLEALSNGGRRGFDAPYMPRGCHYRWFSPLEICFILQRFDAIVFVGDMSLHAIYSGFNILLQEDLATGALNPRSMTSDTTKECRCENQFIKESCMSKWIENSHQLGSSNEGSACKKISHAFIEVTSSDVSSQVESDFQRLAPPAPRSNYKPIPIIHSVSPSSFSHGDAQLSLLQFLKLADESKRKTPMLWIGPTAAGHIEIKGRKGNQEIWEFDHIMRKTAEENDIEVLGMWNMTVQASSWDGIRFGEKVAITQAMMVMNWLSRLESS